MSRFWSQVTRDLHPYVPGEQPRGADIIKLNTNEHPLAPSGKALAAMAAVSPDQLRRYPDPECSALRAAIADVEGLSPDQVFVGNGSDEVLAHVFQALLSHCSDLTAPDITYSFYPVWAQLYRLTLTPVPVTEDFRVDVDALCRQPGSVLIANPNAPTGIALDLDALKTLLSSNTNRLVVVDEAYFGFGAETAAQLISDYDNLVVTRSLSKSHALAGLRVGYALAQPALIEGLVRVKDSFNSYPLDAIAQAGARAAIEDREWMTHSADTVRRNRETLSAALEALGFSVCPSQANFVFARHLDHSGEALFEHLRQNHILVRRWDKPRISEHLRITIGTAEQCQALIDCLSAYL